ncbi:MAG: (d)CMP kinase [bacterium]
MNSECGIIITIDGPAGSGKSTLARGLAHELGLVYLNTGATYRALALKAVNLGIDLDNESETASLAHKTDIAFKTSGPDKENQCVFLDGQDVTDAIGKNEISIAASRISRHTLVREAMVELQRRIAEEECARGNEEHSSEKKISGVVAEGRDTGTVVFPDANVKLFLIASPDERARRRIHDFTDNEANLEKARAEISKRDLMDTTRDASPLKPAPDAIFIDNTGWEREETLAHALEIIRKKIPSLN